jgi:hypothetical protein
MINIANIFVSFLALPNWVDYARSSSFVYVLSNWLHNSLDAQRPFTSGNMPLARENTVSLLAESPLTFD